MSLDALLNKWRRIGDKLAKRAASESVLKNRAKVEVPKSERVIVENRVCKRLQPLVRRILVSKYNRSGIKTKTGKILQALEGCQVWISRTKSAARLMIGWKPGIPGEKKAKRRQDKSVYVYGSSLNYGSLRSKRGSLGHITAKNKKKLRERVLKKINNAKLHGKTKFRGHREWRKTKSGAVRSRAGKLTVFPARNFFSVQGSEGILIKFFTKFYQEEYKRFQLEQRKKLNGS